MKNTKIYIIIITVISIFMIYICCINIQKKISKPPQNPLMTFKYEQVADPSWKKEILYVITNDGKHYKFHEIPFSGDEKVNVNDISEEKFIISLSSNETLEYHWELDKVESVLNNMIFEKEYYLEPKGKKGKEIGVGVSFRRQNFVFKVNNSDKSILVFKYVHNDKYVNDKERIGNKVIIEIDV